MITIVITGKPIPWRAAYVGRRGSFSPRAKELKAFKEIVKSQYSDKLIDYAIICDIKIYMPVPKNKTKAIRTLMLDRSLRPIQRPDRTNIAKLYEDALIGTVITDDSLIVGGVVEKWYSLDPGVEMFIYPSNQIFYPSNFPALQLCPS